MTRLCIYPKDIQKITGKSERYGRYTMAHIKLIHNKQKHHLVTIYELSDYLDLSVEQIRKLLK